MTPAVVVATASPSRTAMPAPSTARRPRRGRAVCPSIGARRVEHEQEGSAAEGHADELAPGPAGRGEDGDRQQDEHEGDTEVVLPPPAYRGRSAT